MTVPESLLWASQVVSEITRTSEPTSTSSMAGLWRAAHAVSIEKGNSFVFSNFMFSLLSYNRRQTLQIISRFFLSIRIFQNILFFERRGRALGGEEGKIKTPPWEENS